MQIAQIQLGTQVSTWAAQHNGHWHELEGDLDSWLSSGILPTLGAVLDQTLEPRILAPIQSQEVWAAGVTYKRSQEARKLESKGSDFYDRVYEADRPELFFKGSRSRACGPHQAVGIRHDATWNVPEPELALVLNAQGQIVGFTIGNDMSSRDIEGQNPLYLPQAKTYAKALGLGPCIITANSVKDPLKLGVKLEILRNGTTVFSGETSTAQLNRSLEDLASYLFRSQVFAHGVILLTGTGVVPGADFTLEQGDLIRIEIEALGVLENPVIRV